MQTRKAKARLAEQSERSKAASLVSASSIVSSRAQLEAEIKRVEAEQTLLEQETKRKRDLFIKKLSLLEELAETMGELEVAEEQGANEKVNSWLGSNNLQQEVGNGKHESNDDDSDEETDDSIDETATSDTSEEGDGDDGGSRSFVPLRKSTPTRQTLAKLPNADRTCLNRSQNTLTQEQIAARQVVSRDLPKFGGNP